MARQLANRDLAVVLSKPSASIHSMKSFDLTNLLHVPGFIHGKEKGTHLPFRVSLEALEKPMRKTRQGVRPLRGRIPHVAWLRIKEVSRFPVSQRCAERNMVEVRTRADAQVHFGKERCSPRGNRGQRRQSTTTPAHWQGRLPSHGRRFHRWMQLNHLPSMYYAKDTKSYAESLSRRISCRNAPQ